MLLKTICFIISANLAGIYVQAEPNQCAEQILPKDGRAAIAKAYPNYRVVSLSDLDEDERAMWSNDHRNACPGVTAGRFDSRHDTTYAVSIFKGLGNYHYREALILREQAEGNYSLRVLYPASDLAAHIYVVWQQPPGVYRNPATKQKTKAAWPVITYEAIGADAMGFYWHGIEYKSIILSE